MKILYIYGDDDYAVLEFQGGEHAKMPYAEAWEKAINEEGATWEFSEGCYAEALEFEGKVDKDFIEFLNDRKDYDSTKHNDWFLVE